MQGTATAAPDAQTRPAQEMRYLLLSALLIAALGCSGTAKRARTSAPELTTHLNLGDPLPSDARATGTLIVVAPAQMWPKHEWVDRGIEYSLAANQARLQYIATSSLEVQTPDGVRVGQTLEEVLRAQELEVQLWPGWGYFVELPSGWKAALFLEGQFLERRPRATDQIDMLFKGTAAGYGS